MQRIDDIIAKLEKLKEKYGNIRVVSYVPGNDEYNEVRKISFFIYDRDSYEILIDSKNYFYIKHYRRRKNSYVYYKSKNDGIIPLIKKIIQKNIKNNL